LNGSVQGQLIH